MAVGLAVIGALIAPLHVRAQAREPLELSWHAPAGCPREAQVRERIRKLSGRNWPDVLPLRAEVSIDRLKGGKLHLRLVAQAGELLEERALDGSGCEELANAAVIHLALLLRGAEQIPAAANGGSAERPAADERARTQAAPLSVSAPQSIESAAPAAAPEPAITQSSRNIQGVLQLPVALLAVGPVPAPRLGLALASGLRIARWDVLIEGQAWLAQTLYLPEEPGVGARIDILSAGLRTCRAFSWNLIELAPCAHLSLQHLRARGTGPHVAARTAHQSWLAGGLGVQARLRLGAFFGLMAQLDLQLEAARPRITVDGAGILGKLGPAALSFGLGLEWIL